MTDAAARPLIADNDTPHPRHSSDSASSHHSSLDSPESDHDSHDSHDSHSHDPNSTSHPPTPTLILLLLTASLSGLLFGYDTGIISSTLVSLSPSSLSRPLSTWDKSVLTSCTSLFALFASPLTGILADLFGRKKVILAASALFVLGAGMQACAGSVGAMVVGRSVVGVAVGSASFAVPMYVAEVAPAAYRGRLVTVVSLFITAGQVVAYLVGWAFSEREDGWRWMVGIGGVPAVLQILCAAGMEESPRWLVGRGRKGEARGVLGRVLGGRGVEGVLRGVEREVREESELCGSGGEKGVLAGVRRVRGQFEMLIHDGGNRRALAIACMLQGFQQLCGFNSLMYFSATIFSLLGFHSPTLASLSIALTNFTFTLVAFHYIDLIGRRLILLLSIPVMSFALFCAAIAFSFVDLDSNATDHTLLLPRDTPSQSETWPLIILLTTTLYVAAYAVGLGCVPWQQSELFPLQTRSLGSSLATATNWASNTIVGVTFLPLMGAITPGGAFAVYAVVCVGCWGVVWGVFPETAGLGIEDVGGLLGEGWGVGESVRRFRERRGG